MFYPIVFLLGYMICHLIWKQKLSDSDRVYNHAKCINCDEPDHPLYCEHCSERFNAIDEYRNSL